MAVLNGAIPLEAALRGLRAVADQDTRVSQRGLTMFACYLPIPLELEWSVAPVCKVESMRAASWMSRFDCLEILLHAGPLHPDLSLGRGVLMACRPVNANRVH